VIFPFVLVVVIIHLRYALPPAASMLSSNSTTSTSFGHRFFSSSNSATDIRKVKKLFVFSKKPLMLYHHQQVLGERKIKKYYVVSCTFNRSHQRKNQNTSLWSSPLPAQKKTTSKLILDSSVLPSFSPLSVHFSGPAKFLLDYVGRTAYVQNLPKTLRERIEIMVTPALAEAPMRRLTVSPLTTKATTTTEELRVELSRNSSTANHTFPFSPKTATVEGHWSLNLSHYDPNDIILVSYLTHMPKEGRTERKGFLNFLLSARLSGFTRIVFIGYGAPRRSKMSAHALYVQMRYALEDRFHVHPKQVVIFADLYDTLWLGSMEEHLNRYKKYFVRKDRSGLGGGDIWPVVVQGDITRLCDGEHLERAYQQYWTETIDRQCSSSNSTHHLFQCPLPRPTFKELVNSTHLSPYPNTGHYMGRAGDLLDVLEDIFYGKKRGIDQGWACRNLVERKKLPLRRFVAALNGTRVQPRQIVEVDGHGLLSTNANTDYKFNRSDAILPLTLFSTNCPLAKDLNYLRCNRKPAFGLQSKQRLRFV